MDRTGIIHLLNQIHLYTWNTDTGRFCNKIKLINNSGADSIKGTLVMAAHGIGYGWEVLPADGDDCIGVVGEDEIADGEETFIINSGSALVLLQNSTASTQGFWARSSLTVAGRADITNAVPPGHGIVNVELHFHQLGHSVEDKVGGTNILAEIIIGFN